MLSMFRVSARRQPPVWGDGLLEHGLSTLWYPCNWQSVDDDELVLLIPSLLSDHPSLSQHGLSGGVNGPAAHTYRHLTARLASMGMSPVSDRAASPYELAQKSGAISVYLAVGSAAKDEQAVREGPRPIREGSPPPFNLAFWSEELCALATMDRMLYDALPVTLRRVSPLLERPELADILLATIQTNTNGAYVYPEAVYAQELLTAGAWLGVVLTGRKALMPSTVGEVLLSNLANLDRSRRADGSSEQRVVQILEYYCEQTGGTDRLLHAARLAVGKSPRVFRSRRPRRAPDTTGATIWNPALSRRIDSFLEAAGAKQRES